MTEIQFRNKITWFSFGFSLLVVWIHAYNAELFMGKSGTVRLAAAVELALGEGIGQIAVPGFFMISGYLFFSGFTWDKLLGKWERRIRSVLVPYIIWNFLYYAGYVIGSRLPWMGEIIGKGTVPWNLRELTEALLNYKYNVVFWYLYQLIQLILLAPVLYLMLRRCWSRMVFFVVLGGMIVCGVQLPFLNTDALMYYASAASAALAENSWVRDPDIRGVQGRKQWCKRMLLGTAFLVLAYFFYYAGNLFMRPAWFVGCRLLAVTGLWLLVPAQVFPDAGGMIRSHFFLYTTHFAFVRLINKTAAHFLAPTANYAVPLLLYLAMPGIVLCISGICVKIIKKPFPRFFRILNGGR